ncbi:hypothetical protein KQI63_07335 [bacterium]|nr:hypothetical protein [bacterium]
MKRGLILFGLFAMMLVMGCTANLPNANMASFEYEMDDMEVLGRVDGSSEAVALLGGFIILEPDGSYEKAYKDALSKKEGANALINVYSDMEITQYFGGFYIKYKTIVHGTAVKVDSRYGLID